MNTENIEYYCNAACKYNGRTNSNAYVPCPLKNRGLKKDKNTRKCFGNKCGFFIDNRKENLKK